MSVYGYIIALEYHVDYVSQYDLKLIVCSIVCRLKITGYVFESGHIRSAGHWII